MCSRVWILNSDLGFSLDIALNVCLILDNPCLTSLSEPEFPTVEWGMW